MSIFCFDLDGTIFNSLEGIYYSLNYACQKYNLKLIPKKEFKNYIGPPLKNYLKSVINSNINDQIISEIIKEFRFHHDNEGYKYYKIYPKMLEVIRLLEKDNKLFILTNKPFNITYRSMEFFKLNKFFEEYFCPDKSSVFIKDWSKGLVKSKSNYLKYIDQKTQKKIRKYFIGDTISDYLATKESCFEFIYASYGYGDNMNFKEMQTINKPSDLERFLKE